jgi:hypothetical protein
MHDTDEEPLKGSTLYAQYGKVILFIHRWHFQTVACGKCGAARLFFNFLSAQKN